MFSACFSPVLHSHSFSDLQGLISAMKLALLVTLHILTLALEPEFLDAGYSDIYI